MVSDPGILATVEMKFVFIWTFQMKMDDWRLVEAM